MEEISIEQARPKLGDLVRDAQQHGIKTLITRNGKPAAVLVPVEWFERAGAELARDSYARSTM